MRHVLSSVLCCALAGAAAISARAENPPKWATIKGRVVFPKGKEIPKREALNVMQDQKHCLANGKILDESVIVNPNNRGVKNVVVYLRPFNPMQAEFAKEEVHSADAKRKPAEVVIDQPCCMFVGRVTCARVGDTIVVKNPSPVNHNFFWDSGENGSMNVNIAPKMDWKMPKPLKAESPPIQFKCTIHPWMAGYVRIFDHPYYAVTDADGNFEIKDAPVGNYRIVFWHENGVRGGRAGRFGEVIAVKGPTTEMKPTDFDVSPR